jgi:hypothetical protein
MANTNAQGKVPNVAQHGYGSFRTDMFGRIKISEGYVLFDSSHRYNENGDFSDITASGASVSHIAEQSSSALTVSTTSGSKVLRETKKVFPYQPGKSLQIMQTFVFAPAKTNLRQRAGYFGRQNGFYLEQDGTNVYLVKRSYITGEVVETRIPQSQWNVDTLDGNGPSDITLDLTKAQILFTEIEWLGVGSVRMGFAIDGYFIICHQFNHANHIDSVYMTTATLPIRYEIENTGTTSSSSTMKQVCVSVVSNGGYFKSSNPRHAIRTSTTVSTTYYPLVAIRMPSNRTESVIIPGSIDLFPTSSADFDYALIKNPTSITGGSWVLHDSLNVEYNISATAMDGGQKMLEGFFGATNQAVAGSSSDAGNFAFQLGRTNADTPVSDVMVLAVRTVSGNGNVKSALGWFDLL